MLRRVLLSVATVATSIVLFAGCSGDQPANDSATPAANSASAVAASPMSRRVTCAPRDLPAGAGKLPSLTGTWAGDDDSIAYVHQVGDQVWWAALSGLDGPVADLGLQFFNVYRGSLAGTTISGGYADVPADPGGAMNEDDTLVFKVRTTNGKVTLEQPESQESEYGARRFEPCTKKVE